jgi:hypothetical protein
MYTSWKRSAASRFKLLQSYQSSERANMLDTLLPQHEKLYQT